MSQKLIAKRNGKPTPAVAVEHDSQLDRLKRLNQLDRLHLADLADLVETQS